MHTYKKILGEEKNLRYIVLANMVSRFGDSVDAVAFSWMVYQITGSMAWLTIILGANMIPTVFFQPFFGGLTEYFNKKRIIVICDILRGCIVFLTCMALFFDMIDPWKLLVLTMCNSTAEAFRMPSGVAILPQILESKNYKAAISLDQGIRKVSELIGTGCAGIIIGCMGIEGALIVDVITFMASGLLLSFLKVDDQHGIKSKFEFRAYTESLKEGFIYFKRNHVAMTTCAVCIILNLTSLPIENFQAAYISEYLRLDVFAMSVGGSAVTAGMICGPLFLPKILKKVKEKQLLVSGGVFLGFLYFIYILLGSIVPAEGRYIGYFITAFMFGFINSAIGVTVQIIFVSQTPEELVGRISGIFNALACSSMPVGSYILAVLSVLLPIRDIYLFTGICSILVFVVIGRRKGINSIDLSD